MDDRPDSDDRCDPEELVRLMYAGDLAAMEHITRCYGARLLAAGRRYCQNEQAARDAVQDAILTAGMKLADFRGDGSVEGWLVHMVANFCRRMQRGRKNDPLLHIRLDDAGVAETADPAAISPEDQVARGQLLNLLGDALLQLAPQDRAFVLLSDAEGWTSEEIAQRFDMTAAAVRTRLSRARHRLRDHLGPLRDFLDD